MSIPTTKTWVDDEVVTAADLNAYLRDAFTWLISGLPIFYGYGSTVQTLSTGWNNIDIHTEVIKSGFTHSANADVITPTEPGWYAVGFGCSFDGADGNATTGQRGYGIAKNGTAVNGTRHAAGAAYLTSDDIKGMAGSALVYCNGTSDYIGGIAYNGAGITVHTDVGASQQPFLTAVWYARDET